MVLYIDNLSIPLIVRLFFFFRNYNKIYFIESSKSARFIINLINKSKLLFFEELKFQLIKIKDLNGELVRLRIPRKDLFEFHDKIQKDYFINI